ncbi:MAG: alkaline phosphatase family protein [bacterium]
MTLLSMVRPSIARQRGRRHASSTLLAARAATGADWRMRLAATVACAFGLLLHAGAASAQVAKKPTLVVLVTIDQFRADYIDRFGRQMDGGIARLVRGGAVFTDAHQDHGITETAPGHATLLAGRFPRSTGIIMNSIGVTDPSAPLLAGAFGNGASPKRFVGTTLVDWLHSDDARSHALSVSMKDRAAILPVGKSRADVYWYSPDGRFTTSSYYRDSMPGWVTAFNEQGFGQRYGGKTWDLLLKESEYPEPDSVPVEAMGKGFTFPHALPEDGYDAASVIRATPFIDDLVVSFALEGVRSLKLGTGPQTDLLAVSLSATDVIGHTFGPDSREIHDQVLRVDHAVGRLLDSLYAMRDSSTVTVVLTADHGVGTIPELAPASVQPRPVRAHLAGVLAPIRVGMAKAHLDTLAIDLDQDLVFADRAKFKAARVNADSVLGVVAAALRAAPGVERVDRFSALLADTLKDPIARRWAHQFPATAQIEMIVTLTPFSTFGGNVASHGSPHDYDSHVPLIFYGAGVRPGRYSEFVRTVDLAPTLAALAEVKPTERIDGVVLKQAVR